MTPAQQSPPPEKATWKIEYQRESTIPNPAGGFQTGMTVGFRTSHDVVGSVFLPYASYTPERVRAAIQARVDQIDNVHNLAG